MPKKAPMRLAKSCWTKNGRFRPFCAAQGRNCQYGRTTPGHTSRDRHSSSSGIYLHSGMARARLKGTERGLFGTGRGFGVGPILTGMSKPVQVLDRDAEVEEIVNIRATAVVVAQDTGMPLEHKAGV